MMKRLFSLMMALCLLLTGVAFAEEDEEYSLSDLIISVEEEETETPAEETEAVDEDGIYIEEDLSELIDTLELDVELDTENQIDPASLDLNPNLPDNVVNILLVGIDTRDTELAEGLQQGDVQIILSLNKETGSVKLTSIVRDLYVTIPGYKNMNRINVAYARGGGELAMRTVNKNFDMNIEYYATINFYGLASIIDAIGGIDIEMTKKEAAAINTYLRKHPPKYDNTDGSARVELEKVDGVQHLDGVQAVMYARVRSIDNDFARTARQRKLLELLLSKVMQDMTIDKLMSLIETSIPYVQTNMGLNTLFELAYNLVAKTDIIQRAQNGETLMEQHRIPLDEPKTWTYHTTSGGSSVVSYTKTDNPNNANYKKRKQTNIQALHEFIYGAYYPADAQ